MTIQLKTICGEFVGELPNGSYEVPDGSTALETLEFCIRLHAERTVPADRLARLMFMRGGKHISPDTALVEGDHLTVLRPLYGG